METDGLIVNSAVIKSSALSVWVGLNVAESDQSAGRRDSRSPVALKGNSRPESSWLGSQGALTADTRPWLVSEGQDAALGGVCPLPPRFP